MNYTVEKISYSSSDWHDWKESTHFFSENNNFLFDKEKALDFIKKDIENSNMDLKLNKAVDEIEDHTVLLDKDEEYIYLECSEEKDCFTIHWLSYIFSGRDTYILKECVDPVYIPCYAFIEAPKIDPGTVRAYDIYKDKNEALKALKEMKPLSEDKIRPFLFQETCIRVIPTKELKLVEEEKKLIELRKKDEDKYWKTFHPFRSRHFEQAFPDNIKEI